MSVRYLVMVLVTLTLLSIFSGTSNAVIYVDDDNSGDPSMDGTPAHPYDTIQRGIDNATDGDLILVKNGMYDGNIVIDVENLTIDRNAGTVVIDADENGSGVHVTANNVTLKNLNFTNSELGGGASARFAGVYAEGNDFSIEACEFYDNKYGLFVERVSGLTVTDCDFLDSRWGVYLTRCDDVALEGLEIFGSSLSGVTVYTSTNLTIGESLTRELYVEDAPYGVQILGGSSGVTLRVTGTDLSSYGVEVDSVTDADIVLDLWGLPSGGLRVEESSLIVVTGSIEADGRCVYVPESTGVVLEDMYLNGTDEGTQKKGLYLYDGADVTGDDIYFGNLREAVYLQDNCNATLMNVTFFGAASYDYDGVSQDSRLVMTNVDYQNASTGVFNAQGTGWVSSRNVIDIEIDLVNGGPASNADVRVRCEEGTLYSSTGFSGTDPKTDTPGRVYGIGVPYLYADIDGTYQNVTEVDIDTGSWIGTRTIDTSREDTVLIIANDPAGLDGYVPDDTYTSDIDVPFHCIYTDPEGQEPTVHSVWVNGIEYELETNDTDFTTAHYVRSIPLMRDAYVYWFEFNDTRVRTITNASMVVVENAPPVLKNPIETRGWPDYPFINFTVNYTDKEGDAPDKVYMNLNGTNHTMHKTDNTTDYVAGVMFNISLELENGDFPYYFIANDTLGDWSEVPVPQILSVEYVRPVLSEGRVSRDNGTAETNFTFRVKYQHTNEKYPEDSKQEGSPYVFFNNRSWEMDLVDEDVSPMFGIEYMFTASGIPHGEYSFYFHANDGVFSTRTGTSNITIYNTPPSIEFDYDPAEGNKFTPYDLTITVTDPDNDPVEYLTMGLEGTLYTWGSPTLPLYEVTPEDNSTFNGKEFWIKKSGLGNGFRSYEIETSDGMDDSLLEGAFPVDFAPDIQVGLFPLVPDENTLVRFKCNYSDRDENWPVNVSIYFERTSDGAIFGPYEMKAKSDRDKTVWDGKDYEYKRTFLAEDTDFGPDKYRYQVVASDGYLETSSVWLPFTVEPADNPPTLKDPKFDPMGGMAGTVFTFDIVYSDPDGDAPKEIFVTFNQNITGLDPVDPDNPGNTDYVPTAEELIAGVTYRIKMEIKYPGRYSIGFKAYSGDENLEVVNNTGSEIRVRGVDDIQDPGEEGEESYTLYIVLAIVIPIAIGLIAGLITRTKKPARTESEEEEKEGDEEEEDVDWSFDDEDEMDEDEDEEDIEWE